MTSELYYVDAHIIQLYLQQSCEIAKKKSGDLYLYHMTVNKYYCSLWSPTVLLVLQNHRSLYPVAVFNVIHEWIVHACTQGSVVKS